MISGTKKKRSYLVVGLGRFGSALCEKLTELGQYVIGVDSMRQPVNELADKIAVAAQLDVTDESALRKAGAADADTAIVTIGEAVEKSILCTSILVEMGIPFVIARATNALHARVLEHVGAHRVIFPERDMGFSMGEKLVFPWYSAFTHIDGGDFLLGSISPMPEMIGRNLLELKFSQKYKVIVILMEYGGAQHTPDVSRPFEKDDKIWVLGHTADIGRLAAESEIDGVCGSDQENYRTL
ncbi:MAG: TrkA family potassium uptake protein [Synergistes sp.]|nr:TrkA family potassium uptake protein [Synergistes sp.]